MEMYLITPAIIFVQQRLKLQREITSSKSYYCIARN
jgi:hypothetical protein